jgi:single-strand DNA-binding protein|tara:strand:+ start:621 stop:968 length:348 start_codon:yes stop_codon:yes gene_type:complete
MKQITIAGNVTKDAILREHNGNHVLGFSVAVQEGFGANKTTLFFDCSYWGKAAQAITDYVKKGIKISVSGDLSLREHNGNKYLTIKATAVTLLGGSAREQSPQEVPNIQDDEIPF